jgi:acid phosphatase (class A)
VPARYAILLGLLILLVAAFAGAQSPQAPAAAPQMPPMRRPGQGVSGYLKPGEMPNFLQILPPVPVRQSKEDEADVALLRLWQQPGNSPRWQLAQADADPVYSRFSEAFGGDIDPAKTPLLSHLLDRVEADMSGPLGQAKDFYHRPRPYQRFAMEHVCGFASAPAPESSPKTGNSYPSGHATFGWSTALVLAEVAPDRAQTILARAREYGESRMVCAAHFPSDVLGAELLVTAVFSRLQGVVDYNRDLKCAQQEHAVALKTKEQLSPACLVLRTQFAAKP